MLVFCLISLFICAAALGTLRLYGLYLEHRISETSAKIEACTEQNLVMSRRCSEMFSPARVYSYARQNLGMMNAENVQTIKVDKRVLMASVAAANPPAPVNAGLRDFFDPFVKKAHAKN